MVVGQDHTTESAPGVDRLEQTLQMLRQRWARVYDVGGVIADGDPGVRARQRERSWVLGTQAHDVIAGEPLGVVIGIAAAVVLEILMRVAVKAGWKQGSHPARVLALPEDPQQPPPTIERRAVARKTRQAQGEKTDGAPEKGARAGLILPE